MLINDLSHKISFYKDDLDRLISRVVGRASFVLGSEVKHFEGSFASYIGASHCITVANGTDAIELALKALGVGVGDRVATAANAGMYTTTACQAVGALPLFIDVDLDSRNVTLAEVTRALDAGVKAVVVTHLYGLACPEIEEIATLCRHRGVRLLEDCAQAHGARVRGRRVGTFGDAASFSFYPTKNLGALGDGGAVITDNAEIAAQISQLRQYGWTSKYRVEVAGGRNSRLDEIQAAILSLFLSDLDLANARRRAIATHYSQSIRHFNITTPPVYGEESVAHLYVIRVKERDSLREHLRRGGISTDIHYPIPDYRQPVCGDQYADMYLPNTELLSTEILTLPLYPEMSDGDVANIVTRVNTW